MTTFGAGGGTLGSMRLRAGFTSVGGNVSEKVTTVASKVSKSSSANVGVGGGAGGGGGAAGAGAGVGAGTGAGVGLGARA